jgi:hypothetical protein
LNIHSPLYILFYGTFKCVTISHGIQDRIFSQCILHQTHKKLNSVNIILHTKWLFGSLIILDHNRVVFLLNRRPFLKGLTAETYSGGCDKSIWPGLLLPMKCFLLFVMSSLKPVFAESQWLYHRNQHKTPCIIVLTRKTLL